jgi:pimeloyl-ACP methyl ester carboxylesterase
MNRRLFLIGSFALGFAATPAVAAAPARWEPTRFSVEVRGTGPDVILIPGLTAGRDVWNGTVASVAGYRYHLVHVAGFAGAPAGGNRQGAVVQPLADELARYISERRLRQPAIVGHSMGGTLAMMIAARRPELVGKIMVVDMLPQPAGLFGGSASSWGPFATSFRNMISSTGGQRLFANLMSAFSPPGSTNRRSDADVVGRAMHELIETDLTPQLARIRAPLTVVYAVSDPRARQAVDSNFSRAYANAHGARLVRIDGSGHMVMVDQPGRFQVALRRFLAT